MTLDRGEMHNALDPATFDAIVDVGSRLAADHNILRLKPAVAQGDSLPDDRRPATLAAGAAAWPGADALAGRPGRGRPWADEVASRPVDPAVCLG
ncbi:hypothetical protein ACWDUD_27900 [Rhodococcus sp. NPDC003382]